MGSKNHEVVPTPLIEKLSHRRGGASAVHKSISNLARFGLVARMREARYDGYRLTYGGLDYLALHAHLAGGHVYSVGSRIGVGKESDIVVVADQEGEKRVLKLHRLGRVSFRTVKTNRDYLKGGRRQSTGSWLYLSRLSAMREFAFLRALADAGFPVPDPIASSRHTIVMSFIDDALPLRQIVAVPDPAGLYAELIELILRLARHGLIHGDFNEFNILVKEVEAEPELEAEGGPQEEPRDLEGERRDGEQRQQPKQTASIKLIPIVIDFPQMVSMNHANAQMYFDRDVSCIKRFFERRFHFVSTTPGPFFKDTKKSVGKDGAVRIDAAVEASGFTKKMAKDLEAAIQEQTASLGAQDASDDDSEDDSEDDEEESPFEAKYLDQNGLEDSTSHVDPETSDPEMPESDHGYDAGLSPEDIARGELVKLSIAIDA